MIENSDSDHSLPDWVIFLGRALARLLCSVAPPALRKAILRRVDPLDVGEDDVLSDNPKQDPFRLLSSANALGESVAGLLYRQHMSIAQGPQGERTTTTECADHGQPLRGLLRGDVEVDESGDDDGVPRTRSSQDESRQVKSSDRAPHKRSELSDGQVANMLCYFERLFFEVDSLDASGFIDREECDALLSYCALDLEPAQRAAVFKSYDYNGNGLLNRVEFCQMCFDTLWGIPYDRLENAVANLKNAHTGATRRNATRWKRVAQSSDLWSRTVIPALYFLALIVVLHLDFRDSYEQPGSEMFTGPGLVSINDTGVLLLCIYCGAAVLSGLAWWVSADLSARQAAKRRSAFKAATTAASHSKLSRRATSANVLQAGAASLYMVDGPQERGAWDSDEIERGSHLNGPSACPPASRTRVVPIHTPQPPAT